MTYLSPIEAEALILLILQSAAQSRDFTSSWPRPLCTTPSVWVWLVINSYHICRVKFIICCSETMHMTNDFTYCSITLCVIFTSGWIDLQPFCYLFVLIGSAWQLLKSSFFQDLVNLFELISGCGEL